jgi:glycosyltransferase involved in cell wall biosynthesis
METNKKKIAVIGLKGLPAFGGAATVGENIINQLQDVYSFTVYSVSSHTNLETGIYNKYYQKVFRKIPIKKINVFFYYLRAAFHAVFFVHYDLVHLHHGDGAYILPVLRLKYKVLLTTHGAFEVRDKWKKFKWLLLIQDKYFTKLASKVTCVSLNEQRMFKDIAKTDAVYIPNGINIIPENTLNFIPNQHDYLFFGAGRIIKTKGCDILLKALHKIKFEGKLLIAGDINQMPKHKAELEELSKGLDIEFLGIIKDKDKLLSFLKHARLFIFPSTMEAMSIMLLEGASVKTPVVCSDIQENIDIFNDNEMLFFKSGNYHDLAEKIHWALHHPKEMRRKANNAYSKLTNDYNWKGISVKYSELYSELMSN